jgi:hypothetical protein
MWSKPMRKESAWPRNGVHCTWSFFAEFAGEGCEGGAVSVLRMLVMKIYTITRWMHISLMRAVQPKGSLKCQGHQVDISAYVGRGRGGNNV